MTTAAIIGCGRIGMGWELDPLRRKPCTHLGAYHAAKIPVVGVCDSDPSKKAILLECMRAIDMDAEVPRFFTSPSEMLRETKPEIVSVCTQVHTHSYVVTWVCVPYPSVRAIFCEKPLTTMPESASECVKICRDKGKVLAVNHTRRWDDRYRSLKKRVDEDGEVFAFAGWYSGDRLEVGIHMYDLANWFAPTRRHEIVRVDAPYPLFEFDLYSPRMRFRAMDNGRKLWMQRVALSPNYSDVDELTEGELLEVPEGMPPMLNAVKEIAKCVETGRGEVSCTGEDGLRALELYDFVR